MSGVANRVIVITGAGGGLGKEYARLLAAAGAQVVVNDLGGTRDGTGSSRGMADAVVEEITATGGAAVAHHEDISTEHGATSLVDTAVETFGGIHGVINNAGILRDAAFHKMSVHAWEAVLRVHLLGSFLVTRAAWPRLRAQAYGRVVFTTSTSGLFGNFGQVNYGAAKLGVVGMMNSLAVEGANHNILANAIAPRAATRLTQGAVPDGILEKLPVSHVAPLVGHLVSDECSVSGVVLIVGGGKIQRAAVHQSQGVAFNEPLSIAQVAERMPEILDMAGSGPGGLILAEPMPDLWP